MDKDKEKIKEEKKIIPFPLDPNHKSLLVIRSLEIENGPEFEQWMLDESGLRVKYIDRLERIDGNIDSLISVRVEDEIVIFDLTKDKKLKADGMDIQWYSKICNHYLEEYKDQDQMEKYKHLKLDIHEY